MNLKKIIIESDTKSGRVFDLFIQFLIIISLISFSIETLPNLSESYIFTLNKIEVITVIIFSIELILRLVLDPRKIRYLLSFNGIIDFIAILPFYLQSGLDLRSIRVFRLLKLFRIFKLLKYGSAIKTFVDAFKQIKSELVVFFFTAIFVIYVSSVGIYYFESAIQPDQFGSVFHCMWWAVATLTTVGYGDVYPITLGGKLFTTLIVFVGLGIVAVPTGLIASAMTVSIKRNNHDK